MQTRSIESYNPIIHTRFGIYSSTFTKNNFYLYFFGIFINIYILLSILSLKLFESTGRKILTNRISIITLTITERITRELLSQIRIHEFFPRFLSITKDIPCRKLIGCCNKRHASQFTHDLTCCKIFSSSIEYLFGCLYVITTIFSKLGPILFRNIFSPVYFHLHMRKTKFNLPHLKALLLC